MLHKGLAAIAASQLLSLASLVQAIPYSEYILTPSQRTLVPVKVYNVNGTVTNAAGLTTSGDGSAEFSGVAAVTFDYTKNIGGLVSFVVDSVSGTDQFIGISFTESSLWISPNGSDATQDFGIDETLWFEITGPGNYSVDPIHDRGGFRYLNVYHNSTGTVSLSHVSTHFTAMPHYAEDELTSYTGYFHSNDEKLNRAWYASAYTNQLCTIPSKSGNSLTGGLIIPDDASAPTTWWSNSTITNGTSALVDGPKRDKLIWPGDFAISVPGIFLSTDDAISIKWSLEQLFATQNTTTGQLPYFAAPIFAYPVNGLIAAVHIIFSFNYHLYTILGLHNYYIYSGDIDYVRENWHRVVIGLNYSLSLVDETGLANVTTSADWLRVGMGGHNIEANAIFAYTLDTAIALAEAVGDLSQTASWANSSATIKTVANTLLWDESAGFYKDNETTTLHPQDGNVWAIISGIASASQATTISTNLAARWGPYGAPAPEAGVTVSPFISSFELQAHFLAGQPQNAIELMRFMFVDFMLDDPRMTNSTYNEGYSMNGDLHYPAYANDPRISHSHGWSTGPIIALTNYVAGIHVINTTNWVVHPQPGNLTSVEAGFTISSGEYSANYTAAAGGSTYTFSTPEGTVGSLILDVPNCAANVQLSSAGKGHGGKGFNWNKHVSGHHGARPAGCGYWGPKGASNGTVKIDGLKGGSYVVDIKCT